MYRTKKFNHRSSLHSLLGRLLSEFYSIYGIEIIRVPKEGFTYEGKSDIHLLTVSLCTTLNMLLSKSSQYYYKKGIIFIAIESSLMHAASINIHKCYALFASGTTDKDDNMECFIISMDATYLGQFIKLLLSNKILK